LSSIRKEYGPAPSRHTMQQAIDELRSEDVLCPRCGRQTFRMLDRDGYRKCDTCYHVFQYPVSEHIP
jgi:protein-arginine kinase activator protein McsA